MNYPNKPMSEEQARKHAIKFYHATKLKNPSSLQKPRFTDRIKGLCENCGFAYAGNVRCEDWAKNDIKCPNCQQVTSNNDEATAVDQINKAEGNKFDYKESVIETVGSK